MFTKINYFQYLNENIINFNNSVLAKHKLLPFFTFNEKTDVFMVLFVNSVTDTLGNV